MITWHNKWRGVANIQGSLDYYVCNGDLKFLFPIVYVDHLAFAKTNHRPIMLTLKVVIDIGIKKKNHSLQFKAFWTKKLRCHDIIEECKRLRRNGCLGH